MRGRNFHSHRYTDGTHYNHYMYCALSSSRMPNEGSRANVVEREFLVEILVDMICCICLGVQTLNVMRGTDPGLASRTLWICWLWCFERQQKCVKYRYCRYFTKIVWLIRVIRVHDYGWSINTFTRFQRFRSLSVTATNDATWRNTICLYRSDTCSNHPFGSFASLETND